MKAYNKSEVDIVFSGWEEDLKQLSEIEVVSVDVLDKIRAEIEQIADEEQKHDKKWAIGLKYAVKIIDKYMKGSE